MNRNPLLCPDDEPHVPWRTGRTVGRTVYACAGTGDPLHDVLIGVLDTPELAARAVADHNASLERP